MKQNRNHLTKKSIFFISIVLCLLILLFINQKAITKAQTVEKKRDKPELVIQTGHASTVNSVAFSLDGKTLASGSEEKFIKLWNVESGQEIKPLVGHTSWVFSVSFSSDGKTLASGSSDSTIKLWNIESGKEIKSLEGHTSLVASIAFSPDGKILASGSYDSTIKLWNIEKGQEILSLEGHTDQVNSVAFSPDGKILASAGWDKSVKLWNVENGQQIKSLEGHTLWVYTIAFSPDGQILASGSYDKSIKLWNTKSGQQIKSLEGHTSTVIPVAFSPDGKILASGSGDSTIKLWNVENGQQIKSLEGHISTVKSIAFSPDGKTLASGSDDKSIKLWDVKSGKQIKSLKSHTGSITSVAFSLDGEIFASGSRNHTIKLWNVKSGEQIKSLEDHTDQINSIAFSPDNKILASGSSDSTIKLWNIESGQIIKYLKGHTYLVDSIAFSPDGKTLASGSYDKTVKLWSIESGQQIKSLESHVDPVASVAFSPDGKTLASGSHDGTVILWNIESGQEIKSLEGRNGWVYSVVFSPDGKILASGSGDSTIKLWNVENGQQIKSLEGSSDLVGSVAFSPDGKTLASGGLDYTVKLWNVKSGQVIKSLESHIDAVDSVAFSPDRKTLLSGSRDATMKLWDVENGKLLSTLISLDKDKWVVTTPDGRFDTNEDLNKIEGLIWVLPDQPLTPKPLELYMRQYFEPGLLARVLPCREENNCDTEFKPLPSIAEINPVQPKVEIKEIKPNANVGGLVDVVVEVESRTEEIAQKRLTSGVFDLRLFRDGQLVGTSARVADLKEYIKSAPQAIEKDRAAKVLLNTEEDKAWRKANDLARVAKFDKNKATYMFENVRLPQDGCKAVEFSAYAFNDDRVKSDTSRKTYEIKSPSAVRAGNTYLISIGVNASENPAYNLFYAAADAYKTQEILGEKLKAKLKGTDAKLIQIQLVSNYEKDTSKIDEKNNTAKKKIIKGVFSLLAGKPKDAESVVNQIPIFIDGQKIEAAKVPPVEPEDTLIITYSGHGYADQNGIFYLLPYDVGANTKALTTEVLPNLISSDELSLWMREVTAKEMLMIVDACHSSAAVQGDGFKPAPMGSRGLGQLAYDKGMKILSATQADNVALELGSLQQGLLSYALLQDGIFNKLADTSQPKDNRLFIREWLKYGERRVPALYGEIKTGAFKDVKIGGKSPDEKQRADIYCLDKQCRQNVQEPKLFDFNERRADSLLINLP